MGLLIKNLLQRLQNGSLSRQKKNRWNKSTGISLYDGYVGDGKQTANLGFRQQLGLEFVDGALPLARGVTHRG